MVFLATKVLAADAVVASFAILAEPELGTVFTVFAESGGEKSHAVETLVADFALGTEATVDTVSRFVCLIVVVQALTLEARDTHVAILATYAVGSEVAVLAGVYNHSDTRDCLLEIVELLEERAIEIEVASMVLCIPIVTPPRSVTVDRVGRVVSIERDHGFSRQITCSSVQVSLVPACESSAMSLLWTVGRCVNRNRLPTQCRSCSPEEVCEGITEGEGGAGYMAVSSWHSGSLAMCYFSSSYRATCQLPIST